MIKIKNKNINKQIEQYIQDVFPLDNFSAFGVTIDGVEYKTAEHAFQTQKFVKTAPDIATIIKNASSPYVARDIAKINKKLRRADWSEVKYDIMKQILTAKTEQNFLVWKALMSTIGNDIIEDCGEDDDKDWGCGIDGTGANNLGKLWVSVRTDLLEQNSTKTI